MKFTISKALSLTAILLTSSFAMEDILEIEQKPGRVRALIKTPKLMCFQFDNMVALHVHRNGVYKIYNRKELLIKKPFFI